MSPSRRRFPSARHRAPQLLERLGALYPHATCSLDWRTPWELLVATMLSAQCTDERVNRITPALFERFRNKAKNIVASAMLLQDHHGGAVPARMEELLELPGVARKTASVVLAHAFGITPGSRWTPTCGG